METVFIYLYFTTAAVGTLALIKYLAGFKRVQVVDVLISLFIVALFFVPALQWLILYHFIDLEPQVFFLKKSPFEKFWIKVGDKWDDFLGYTVWQKDN